MISKIFVSLLLLFAQAAQQSSPQVSLRGIVTDPSGARIPGASVQLRSPAGEQTPTTDANGQYEFLRLSPGRYDVQITAPDFKADQKLAFNVSGASTLNFQLMVEGQSQVVDVQAEATT